MEWTGGDLQRNKESYVDGGVEDSYTDGPPTLYPQVEIIEDEGYGNSILDYEFGEPEHVDIIWAHQSSSIKPPVKRRSHQRQSSDLSSILQKPPKRQSFTYAQYEALFATWEVTDSPSPAQVLELVHITALTPKQVKTWFKNKRTLTRRCGNNWSDMKGTSVADSKLDAMNNKVKSSVNDADSSTNRSTNIESPTIKLTKLDKRERRAEAIQHIPLSKLEECLETSRTRISQLILLYMKRKLDMRRTLLRETNKLKEMTANNPFSESQLNAMRLWRDDFFAELCEGLNDHKKQKMSYVNSNVIQLWHPVVLYGKLTKVSLETAIEDFSCQSGVETVADSEEFTVPGILRYMESHFK